MDAYLAQLRALLKEEPCVIKEKLAQLPSPPDAVPGVVPGGRSGEPLQIPSDVAPQSTPVTPQKAPARPGSMAQLLEQGTVLVLARQPQGLSMGSGFFISRRHVLMDTLRPLHRKTQRYRRASVAQRRQVSTDEHKAICEAICAGNEDEAERLMCEHIQNAKKSMIERFSQNGEYNR